MIKKIGAIIVLGLGLSIIGEAHADFIKYKNYLIPISSEKNSDKPKPTNIETLKPLLKSFTLSLYKNRGPGAIFPLPTVPGMPKPPYYLNELMNTQGEEEIRWKVVDHRNTSECGYLNITYPPNGGNSIVFPYSPYTLPYNFLLLSDGHLTSSNIALSGKETYPWSRCIEATNKYGSSRAVLSINYLFL